MALPLTTVAEASCHRVGTKREPVFKGDFSFNTGRLGKVGTVDNVVFFLGLGITTVIGLIVAWNNRRHQGIEDYLLGGRSMSGWSIALSLTSTYISGIAILGIPLNTFVYSNVYFWKGIIFFLAMVTVERVFMPVFYNLKVTSVHEYLLKRFGSSVRTAAALCYVVLMIVYLAFIVYAPTVALVSATGVNTWDATAVIGAVCMFYVTLGGIKSVIYTDAFQAVVILSGYIIMLIQANSTVGSWSEMWKSAERTRRLHFFDFRIDPSVQRTAWTVSLEEYAISVMFFGTNQLQVHRYLCCKSLETASRYIYLTVICIMLIYYVGGFIGLFMGMFYENCDPKSVGLITAMDQMFPLFVLDMMDETPGIIGVFLVTILSASLSSASSILNSLATVVLEDLIRPNMKTYLRENRARLMTQVITVVSGLISLELAFFGEKMDELLQVATLVVSVLSLPVFGIFVLGMLFPWTNKEGALVALIGGSVFNITFALFFSSTNSLISETALVCVSNCNMTALMELTRALHGDQPPTPIPPEGNYAFSISLRVVPYLGFFLSLILGLAVSYFTGMNDPSEVDPRLLVPLFDVLWPFYRILPESFLVWIRVGVDHTDKRERPTSKKFTPSGSKDMDQERMIGSRELAALTAPVAQIKSETMAPEQIIYRVKKSTAV